MKQIVKSALVKFSHVYSVLLWRRLRMKSDIYLDLGSGPRKGRGKWTTVDVWGSDLNWDLRKGIRLPDASVAALYTSHMLEHIPYKELILFLQECRRVLKPGATLSVCVPNFELYVEAYYQKRLFKEREDWWAPALIDTGSLLDQINYIAYMDGQHKYMFDGTNLLNTLRTAGFSSAELRDFDSVVDIEERKFESIYAIATK